MKAKFQLITAGSLRWICLIFAALLLPLSVQAQWVTQTLVIKPGWNAVFLHVDASYASLDQLVGSDSSNPISEVWLWAPAPATLQFVSSPQTPIAGTSQWLNWGRLGLGVTDTLTTLVANGAYLVHSTATTNYTWNILGKPMPPNYVWSSTGLNFLGFPTPPNNPPAFDTFLSLAPVLQSSAEIYLYPGGDLGPNNPMRLFAFHTTPVTRGEAFWIRSGNNFNNYFGPFEIDLQDTTGVNFGTNLSQYSFRLRNTTASNVTVTVTLAPSQIPPAGQPAIVGVPPLLVRGALNTSTLVYGFANLPTSGTQSWTLAPQGQSGSDIQVVLGVNRYALTNGVGSLYAGVLQFTDSYNFSEVDVPVSASPASTAGLWVGNAVVSQVGSYLKSFQMDTNNQLVVSTNGNFIVTSINTNFGPVAQSYPLRLILHNDGTNVFLLQRVYYGLNQYSNIVITTQESLLDPTHLDIARRISAVHLPWSLTNAPWACTGHLVQGGTLTATATIAYDDQSSNPFLHTYHPDHDNLDAFFQNEQPIGYESYQIMRQFTLVISPPGSDFASMTTANQSVSGAYLETMIVTGIAGQTQNFNVGGSFSLNRISSIATLTQQ